MEELSKIFGRRVRELRKSKNFSQEEYAGFIGVNLKTLWNIETGKRSIRFDTITKVVQAEKIPPYKLFMTDEEFETDNLKKLNEETVNLCANLSKNELSALKNFLEVFIK